DSWDNIVIDLSLARNLETLLRVTDAITYAHSRQIVHRDIKPENVMLGRFGEVLVADWGLAMFLGHDQENGDHNPDDSEAAIGGTPAYMAPEQALGQIQQISPATDVYLLGATLFQILTGHAPHRGENLMDCIRNAGNNVIVDRPLLDGRIENIELMRLAGRAMATNPEDRPADARAFAVQLRNCMQYQQSLRLVNRARKRLDNDSNDAAAIKPSGTGAAQTPDPVGAIERVDVYHRFVVAESLLREALEIWPDNAHALDVLRETTRRHAETAAARQDFELAMRLLTSIDAEDSLLAEEIRRGQESQSRIERRERRYTALFSELPEAGILVRESNTQIVDVNQRLLNLLGFERQDLLGKDISHVPLWKFDDQREHYVDQIRVHGLVDNFEAVFLTTDGMPLDVLISARQTLLDGEKFIVGTVRDITARKRAERKLQRSRQRLEGIQRLADLGTWRMDPNTRALRWSSQTRQMVQWPDDQRDPPYDQWLQYVHPEDHGPVMDALQKAMEKGGRWELTLRHRMPDGSYKRLYSRGQAMLDADGNTIELYGTVEDVGETDRLHRQNENMTRVITALLPDDQSWLLVERCGTVMATSAAARQQLGQHISRLTINCENAPTAGERLEVQSADQQPVHIRCQRVQPLENARGSMVVYLGQDD
ncbi:MAG: PAS domain S-box protein, partial [Planctomycetota bacterium]